MDRKSPKKAEAKLANDDVVMVLGRSDDGKSLGVLRQKGDEVYAGSLRPLDEGKPIQGEVIRLKPRDDSSVLYDVDVQLDASPSSGRPAKVASDEYRRGWETIWSKKRTSGVLN